MDESEINEIKNKVKKVIHETVITFTEGLQTLVDPKVSKEDKFMTWLALDQLLWWGERKLNEIIDGES